MTTRIDNILLAVPSWHSDNCQCSSCNDDSLSDSVKMKPTTKHLGRMHLKENYHQNDDNVSCKGFSQIDSERYAENINMNDNDVTSSISNNEDGNLNENWKENNNTFVSGFGYNDNDKNNNNGTRIRRSVLDNDDERENCEKFNNERLVSDGADENVGQVESTRNYSLHSLSDIHSFQSNSLLSCSSYSHNSSPLHSCHHNENEMEYSPCKSSNGHIGELKLKLNLNVDGESLRTDKSYQSTPQHKVVFKKFTIGAKVGKRFRKFITNSDQIKYLKKYSSTSNIGNACHSENLNGMINDDPVMKSRSWAKKVKGTFKKRYWRLIENASSSFWLDSL